MNWGFGVGVGFGFSDLSSLGCSLGGESAFGALRFGGMVGMLWVLGVLIYCAEMVRMVGKVRCFEMGAFECGGGDRLM